MMKRQFILLTDKYLSGTATESEKQLVESYLDRLAIESPSETNTSKEQDIKSAMWQAIQSQTFGANESIVVKIPWYKTKTFRFSAVAACFACLVGLAIFIYQNNQSARSANAGTVQQNLPQSILRQLINTTGDNERYYLPDSSWIILAKGAVATYYEPFTKRNISLSGKGWFKIKKDSSRPFVVKSSAISTTALGTEFLVDASKNSNKLIVRLYEGRVVIKSVDTADWRMKKDYYLQPGDEFVYTNKSSALVHSFRKTRVISRSQDEGTYTDNPFIPQNAKGTWYMFNNQSLAQVFNQLSFTYNTPIIYNKKDVQNKYFVGRFREADSLNIILKYITLTNKLTVVKKENTYYITK